jgi:hypothetical protein
VFVSILRKLCVARRNHLENKYSNRADTLSKGLTHYITYFSPLFFETIELDTLDPVEDF